MYILNLNSGYRLNLPLSPDSSILKKNFIIDKIIVSKQDPNYLIEFYFELQSEEKTIDLGIIKINN